ncbi:MAG: glycosyltransferase family 2 protein [Paludibacteraceae bacterium]|nr:glycosyltransferase family 2 protein [Paludibacteraceae bacterium]
MDNKPTYIPGLVSIITPMYNAGAFIAQAIESVLSQTYTNWEMIIADDCSTDNGFAIASSYASENPKIKVVKTDSNTGCPAGARNRSLAEASGQYIAFLDADDIWGKNKLEKQVAALKDPEVALVYSYYSKFTDHINESRLITAPAFTTYSSMLYGSVIGCLTAIYDASKVGVKQFEKSHHEDYILWLTILKDRYKAICIPEVLAYYRVGESSVSSNKLQSAKWYWDILRGHERISFPRACVYFASYMFKSVIKYLK